MVFALLGLVNTQWVSAQNVTISPRNGSMICALTAGQDAGTQYGFQTGAFATWRHNQLSLTMTASNNTDLTADGQLEKHANHFLSGSNCTFDPTDGNAVYSNYIVMAWGGESTGWGATNNPVPGYFTISLPKGYRFTGYTFHFTRDVATVGENAPFDLTTDRPITFSETDKTFNNTVGSQTITIPGGNSTTVHKLESTSNNMGNILYFKTIATRSGYYALNLRYIELKFTADADAGISLLPSTQTTIGHSMMEIPFNTGKVDLGEIKQGSYQGAQRVSYQYNTVSDMSANMLLYEKESVRAAQEGEVLDGTSGDVAYNRDGSITTNGNYFRFEPSSTKTEQIYYLETPVSATMSNSEENPVQFRITGATINYSKTATRPFLIKYKDGNTTYYLGTNGRFSTTRTQWLKDSEGHIYSGTEYLGGTTGQVQVTNSNGAAKFTINGTTIQNASGYTLKYLNYYGTRYGYYTNSESLSDNWDTYNVYPAEVEYIETTGVSDFTIFIYDKEGNRDSRYPDGITVTGTDYVELEDLNNDAIKFGVKGGDVALLNFELKLQALNPYIDNMTVVLNDNYEGKDIRMTRTFTADDFSVGGGTFRFYLPTDCVNDHLTITFEDLYSKYGDDTYNHTSKPGTSNSRYNFVKSQHHQNFTGDNIYNDRAEAASSTLESARIEAKENIRTQVGTVGNIAFRFNNADELATNNGYLTEYPFTMAKYAAQTGKVVQDGVETTANGNFITAEFEPTKVQTALHDKTFYVFTTDETRYNIAPTTATQHRFYAFYAMKVEVVCQDYSPIVSFEKIYDKTFNENGTGAFYGVKVSAPAGIDAPLASDVATFKAISEAIEEGGDNVPTDLTQILYLDMSGLNGVYHSKPIKEEDNKYTLASFDELKDKFAPNALVFLPANSTATFNNFAYAKKGELAGSFQSANDIILTDKNPFYSPYTIQVDAANYAIYTRKVTKNTYDEVQYATVFMPFTIELDADGQHKSEVKNKDGVIDYGTTKFLQMNGSNATSNNKFDYLGEVDADKAFFTKTSDSQVEANTPYALQIVDKGRSGDSFTLVQYGSNIAATPKTDNLFSATEISSTGKLTDKYGVAANYTFSHVGTFSGAQVAKEQKLFYFANNGFYSSMELKDSYKTVDIYPFRSVYQTSGTGSAKVGYLMLVEGENPNTATGITDVDKVFTGVTTGNGYITITSDADTTYRIRSVSGQNVDALNLKAGETQTVNVPAGIYLVNGLKVLVK